MDITLKSGVIFLTFLFNFFYNQKFKDLSACYKIFKTKHLKSIQLDSKGYTFCYEVVIKFLNKNLSVGQLSIDYSSRDRQSGKKITIMDGFKCFWVIIKNKFLTI